MSAETSDRESESCDAVPGGSPVETGRRGGSGLHAIDLLLVLLLTAALSVLLGIVVDTSRLSLATLVAILAIQSAIPMAAVYLVVIRARGLAWSDIGFRRISRRWAVRAALIGLATLPAVSLVNLAVQALAGRAFRNPQLDFLAPAGFSWEGLLGMLVVVGIVAPFVEETVFRGILYGWLRSRIGIAAGAVISALIFSVAHGILVLTPALAVTGLVLALVYEHSRSLWPAIIVHGFINTVMTIALYAVLATGTVPGG